MTQTGPGGAGQSALPPGLTRAQQIEAAARLKGAARQEALAELLPGWNKAAPYVGKPATEANLPPGMLYGKIPLSNGKFKLVGYLPGKPSGNVPRFEAVPGGTWQVKGMGADGGKLTSDPRIANASEYNKTNPPPRVPGQTGLTQNHHMTPDNIMRGNELFQRGFELGVTSPDRASGMINLATSKSSLETLEGNGYSMSQITHNTKHPRSDALIAEELDTFIAKEQVNGRLPSNLSTAKPKEVQDAIRRWDDQMRDQFMNKPDSFIRNEDGTLAENSSLDTQGRA